MKSKTNKYGIFGDCLRGDVASALRSAKKDKSILSRKEKEQLEKLEQRFRSKSSNERLPNSDPLVRALVFTYRTYYHQMLMKRNGPKDGEKELYIQLKTVLRACGEMPFFAKTLDSLEVELKSKLMAKGYYSLFGKIHPFRSLSIWKTQRSKQHTIVLPETKLTVSVNYVEDLIEHGWMSYATLGRFYAGGWVPDDAKDKIFCVSKAYRRRPEALRVNLLAHEAQHVADLRKFPKLSGADLEYRAKLTELHLSSQPGRLLSKFRSQAVRDSKLPHGFAAWNICNRIQDQRARHIKRSAKNLLLEHSNLLKKRGRQSKSVL